MAVTPESIAAELGRTAPAVSDPVYAQWETWIERAMRTVERRAQRCGLTLDAFNANDVDEVVTYIVVRRISRPVDGAESTTDQIGVDDGNWQQTRRYPTGMGDMHVLDEWWDILGLRNCGSRGAFTIRPRWSPGRRP